MIFPIFLELIARVCFSSIAIVNKFSRKAGASSVGVMAQTVWAIPVFLIIGAVLFYINPSWFNLGGKYWLLLASWIILCLAVNYLLVYVMRYQALTELGGYSRGFAMIAAITFDHFIFDSLNISYLYVFGGLISMAGGIMLGSRKKIKSELDNSIARPFPLWVSLLIVFCVSWLAPLGYTLFKECLIIAKDQMLAHTAIAQTILFTCFWIIGRKDYIHARNQKSLTTSRVGIAVICVITAAIAQTYSIAALNITTLLILGFVGGAMITISDIWSKEIAVTRYNITAISLVFMGSLLIAMSQ